MLLRHFAWANGNVRVQAIRQTASLQDRFADPVGVCRAAWDREFGCFFILPEKLPCASIVKESGWGGSVVKLTLRDKESVQEAVRRFRKLVERSGIKKEMRRREHYEKPSETRRRSRLRAERRAVRNRRLFGI